MRAVFLTIKGGHFTTPIDTGNPGVL